MSCDVCETDHFYVHFEAFFFFLPNFGKALHHSLALPELTMYQCNPIAREVHSPTNMERINKITLKIRLKGQNFNFFASVPIGIAGYNYCLLFWSLHRSALQLSAECAQVQVKKLCSRQFNVFISNFPSSPFEGGETQPTPSPLVRHVWLTGRRSTYHYHMKNIFRNL